MTTQELSFKIIRVFEGLRLIAYQDPGGVWTIGYGHTKGVVPGMRCTPEEARAWFAEDSKALFQEVADIPLLEAAAYVSFGYNCGLGALRKLLHGKITFKDRIRDRRGNVLPGLVSRRELEQALVDVSKSMSS